MKNKITIVLFCASTVLSFAQNKIVKLSLEGKKYDNLYLLADTKDNKSLAVNGISADGYNWTFSIPDTISNICRDYCVRSKNSQSSHIYFRTTVKNDTLEGGYFNFDENKNLIDLKAKFDTTELFENKIYVEELDTTVVFQTWERDFFLIPFPKNRFLREFMQTPMFSFFDDIENQNKTYDEFLKEYAEKIKKNPNSLYYISYFAITPHYYKSKKDIENLFKLFSPKMQNSIWGKMVKKNFELAKLEGIKDLYLPSPLTKRNERIIYDYTKYTLLCFSASWCSPCHKKMPLLKEIYEKTKNKLELIYITIDEDITIPEWNKLMVREHILWRSLHLTNKNLKIDWQISAIPDYILIFPDGMAKKITLNDEQDIKELWALLKIQHFDNQ